MHVSQVLLHLQAPFWSAHEHTNRLHDSIGSGSKPDIMWLNLEINHFHSTVVWMTTCIIDEFPQTASWMSIVAHSCVVPTLGSIPLRGDISKKFYVRLSRLHALKAILSDEWEDDSLTPYRDCRVEQCPVRLQICATDVFSSLTRWNWCCTDRRLHIPPGSFHRLLSSN